jgi:hypothetical protein
MRIQVLIDIEGVTITPEMLGAKLKHAEWLKERLIEVTRENHSLLSELNCTKRHLRKAESEYNALLGKHERTTERYQQVARMFGLDDSEVIIEPFNDEWDALSDAAIDALKQQLKDDEPSSNYS